MSEQAPEELPEPEPPAASQGRVLVAVAAGGALGAVARYGALVVWPVAGGGFPWAVFVVNVSGCALIGVLMVLTVERGRVTHPLVRPFLGVGVLGGFTTFSTYAADVSGLLVRQELLTAVAYLAATVVAALVAVWAGAVVTRRLVDRGGEPGPGPGGARGRGRVA
ncbi:CrcB family protein [Streptomyces sp. ME02-6991-2A]|uniref:fluoride efflux transporter FluC n=1 Tax=Streptomyces sp. ME02-6991-2A TaxID=3028677 RepID=UPI0029A93F77|nr:CrcB family protein [Streptomyces sp. ME02-6991-2A]MDX3379715.1 CrcB family protein [Streptomyces sp. ME02-6991-2A]